MFTPKLKQLALVFISFLFFPVIIYSQSNNWQRIFRGPYIDFDFIGVCATKSDNENYFVFFEDRYNRLAPIYLINKYGDSLKSIYVPNRAGYACVSSGDGGVVFSGGGIKPHLVKLNSSCSVVWDKLYTSGADRTDCYDIIKTSDDRYLMVGGGSLVKADLSGNFIWQKFYPSGFSIDYNCIIEAVGGGYIISGSVRQYLGGPTLGIMSCIDTSGAKLWERIYTMNGTSYGYRYMKIVKINSSYLAGGAIWEPAAGRYIIAFLKLDTEGNIRDTIKYPFQPNNDYFFSDIKRMSDNRIVALYYRDTKQHDSLLSSAMIIDSAGVMVRQQEYAGTDFTMLNKICVSDYNTVLFVGTSNKLTSHAEVAYLVKTDSTLYAPPVSVNNISQTLPESFYLNQNYPNPFNIETQVEFTIYKKDNYALNLYNVSGRLMKKVFNKSFSPGIYKILLDFSDQSSGIYFCTIQNKNEKFTRKLVCFK